MPTVTDFDPITDRAGFVCHGIKLEIVFVKDGPFLVPQLKFLVSEALVPRLLRRRDTWGRYRVTRRTIERLLGRCLAPADPVESPTTCGEDTP